eukprot:Gb_10420 [translate_table: standard]
MEEPNSLPESRSPDLEFVVNNAVGTKGKRSKRTRHGFSGVPNSELEQAAGTSISNGIEEHELEVSNCLLMLAYGGYYSSLACTSKSKADDMKMPNVFKLHKIRKPKDADVDYARNRNCDGALKDVERYKCKTCNRKFHSYQALGGHRTSCHNKTKSCFYTQQENECIDGQLYSFHKSSPQVVMQASCPQVGCGIPNAAKKAKPRALKTQLWDLNMLPPVDEDDSALDSANAEDSHWPPNATKCDCINPPPVQSWWMKSPENMRIHLSNH